MSIRTCVRRTTRFATSLAAIIIFFVATAVGGAFSPPYEDRRAFRSDSEVGTHSPSFVVTLCIRTLEVCVTLNPSYVYVVRIFCT